MASIMKKLRTTSQAEKMITKLKPSDYFRRYLKVTPLSLAISRAIEAKNIASVSMKRPILDIGCGFGEFAGVFFESKVEMGLDISWEELVNAKKGNKYKKLIWTDAKELPFPDNYFSTVLSVSALEHIKGVGQVLKEAYRVLKPDGKLVFTVNCKKINKYLFWPKVLKTLGFENSAKRYIKLYHKVFKHTTLWGKKRWQKELENKGFKTVQIKEIFSPQATSLFDFLLLTAWPSQVIKILTGRRWALKPKWFQEYLVKKYSFLIEREEEEGSNLFVEAVKSGESNFNNTLE